jgi:hypothetical protein
MMNPPRFASGRRARSGGGPSKRQRHRPCGRRLAGVTRTLELHRREMTRRAPLRPAPMNVCGTFFRTEREPAGRQVRRVSPT